MRRWLATTVTTAAISAAALSGCGSSDRLPRASSPLAAPAKPAPLPTAARPWSTVASHDLPDAAPTQSAGLRFSSGGGSTLSWDPPSRDEGAPAVGLRVATVGPNGTPGRSLRIPRSLASGPQIDRAGRARAATFDYDPGSGASGGLGLTTVPADGSRPKTIPVDQGFSELGTFRAAIGPSGMIAMAWIEYTRYDEDSEWVGARIRIAFAPAGTERFGEPTTLASTDRAVDPYENDVALAFGSDGQVAVAADGIAFRGGTRDGLLVWTGRPGAIRGPMVADPGSTRNLAVAVTSSGRAMVAWSLQGGGEEASTGYVVKAASIAPGANRVGSAQTLDPGSLKAFGGWGFSLVTGRDGSAVLAWTGVGRKSYPASVVTAGADGRFGPPQRLTTNGEVGSVAIREDGAAIVTVGPSDTHPADTFDRDPDDELRAVAYVRPAGATRFGAAERLPMPKGPQGRGALVPGPAFDPATGRPSIAYVVAGTQGTPARLVIVTRDKP